MGYGPCQGAFFLGAGAAILVGVAAFLGQPWIGAVGVAAAVIAVVVKERGGRF